MPRQPEGRLVKRIRAYLEGQKAVVFNIHGGDNPYQDAGIPDLLVCWRGLFIALEVKQPGEKLSRLQEVTVDKIRRADGAAMRVDSVEAVEKLLSDLRRKR